MARMNRRRFLGISGAAVAVVAAPILGCKAINAADDANAIHWLLPALPRPEVGAEFYVTSVVPSFSGYSPTFSGERDAAKLLAADFHASAFRRLEEQHGVHFGDYYHDVQWYGDREAWCVTAMRHVIAYA